MQHNDLSTYVDRRHIVVMTPTLFQVPELRRRDRFSMKLGRQSMVDHIDEFVLNSLMVRWITSEGYTHSVPTEVWSFESEDVFEELCLRLLKVADRYIFRCTRWDSESDALADMMSSLSSITRVYDADPDRVDRLWQYNGYRVPLGGAP
jgi:hypothetical protein